MSPMPDDERDRHGPRRRAEGTTGRPGPAGGGTGDSAWGATSYLLSGPLTFGAIGFGLDHLLGTTFCFPVGVVAGVVVAVWYVWFRYGAS